VTLSRLTKGVVGGFFTRNTRIALGHGCDRPNYVSAEYNFIQAICNGNLAKVLKLVDRNTGARVTTCFVVVTTLTTLLLTALLTVLLTLL